MISEHLTTWLGYPVKLYNPEETPDFANTVYRITPPPASGGFFRKKIPSPPFRGYLTDFLDRDGIEQTPAIVIGAYNNESYDDSSAVAIEPLVEHKDRLPNLKGIFLGDFAQEENEISWIIQSDITPLLEAFPALEHLAVRGGNELALKPSRHLALKSLVFESGGLGGDVLQAVSQCVFPELEHIEFYLGTDQYGGNATLEDVRPFLETRLFPKLKYLGLRNAEITDEIAKAAANATAVANLEELDLSLGTLGEEGGEALLKGSSTAKLKKLNLEENFLPPSMEAAFKALPPAVHFGSQRDADENDGYRYCMISE